MSSRDPRRSGFPPLVFDRCEQFVAARCSSCAGVSARADSRKPSRLRWAVARELRLSTWPGRKTTIRARRPLRGRAHRPRLRSHLGRRECARKVLTMPINLTWHRSAKPRISSSRWPVVLGQPRVEKQDEAIDAATLVRDFRRDLGDAVQGESTARCFNVAMNGIVGHDSHVSGPADRYRRRNPRRPGLPKPATNNQESAAGRVAVRCGPLTPDFCGCAVPQPG